MLNYFFQVQIIIIVDKQEVNKIRLLAELYMKIVYEPILN